MFKDHLTRLPLHGASLRGKECCPERDCGRPVEMEVHHSFVKKGSKGESEDDFGTVVIGYCLDHGVRWTVPPDERT